MVKWAPIKGAAAINLVGILAYPTHCPLKVISLWISLYFCLVTFTLLRYRSSASCLFYCFNLLIQNVVVVGNQPTLQPEVVHVRAPRAPDYLLLTAVMMFLCFFHGNLPAIICLVPALLCACAVSILFTSLCWDKHQVIHAYCTYWYVYVSNGFVYSIHLFSCKFVKTDLNTSTGTR